MLKKLNHKLWFRIVVFILGFLCLGGSQVLIIKIFVKNDFLLTFLQGTIFAAIYSVYFLLMGRLYLSNK